MRWSDAVACSALMLPLAEHPVYLPAPAGVRAVRACIRKLVMICYGVLKNRKPFDPQWASKITR